MIEAGRLLFTDHIPRSQNCMKMQFCETCKRCIAKRVTVNGVNSNSRTREAAKWIHSRALSLHSNAALLGLQSTQPKDRRFHRPLIGFHMAISLEVVASGASRFFDSICRK